MTTLRHVHKIFLIQLNLVSRSKREFMCGIAGFTGGPLPDALRAMCGALRHRGPDGSGYYESAAVSLGMRRLAIVDIASGHQPVSNEDGTVHLVVNGEIYNHGRLRRKLERAGHIFHSDHSDSEICPHAFEQWGEIWMQECVGMFAAAWWDESEKTLWLCRDRLGKKPLYYAQAGGRIVFASEIKALLQFPGIPDTIDFAALGQYFSLKNLPAPATSYAAIKELPPGYVLRWREGDISLKQYWSVDFDDPFSMDEQEAAQEICRLLRDAVAIRMRCDVPFGAYLSGGLDSSAVACIMAELSGNPIQTFCLGYADGSGRQMAGKQADIEHARVVAGRLGSEHHELIVGAKEFADAMPEVIRAFDMPFSGTVSTFLISSLIARHVKVALSGDGADELFASYLTHRLAIPVARYLAARKDFDRPGAELTALAPFDSGSSFRFLQGLSSNTRSIWLDNLAVFTTEERKRLLSREIFPAEAFINPYEIYDNLEIPDTLNATLYIDQTGLLPNQVMQFVDRLSMAHSVEVRSPFLDHRLVEFSNRLPGSYKIKGRKTKAVLRMALKEVLPVEIIDRPKEGFVQPVYTWMHNELYGWVEERLAELPFHILHRAEIARIVSAWRSGGSRQNAQIWSLVCFALWWKGRHASC